MEYRELELAGVDMKDLLVRLMQNTALIRMIIGKFLEDSTYTTLLEAVNAGDMQAAETAAHTLKGLTGNLSLTELFELSKQQLSLFHNGESAGAAHLMDDISNAYEKATVHMQKWLAQQ